MCVQEKGRLENKEKKKKTDIKEENVPRLRLI